MATKDEILTLLLSLVDAKYDKRDGSPIYDALAPVAEKLALIDTSIEETRNKMLIDNLTGLELETRVNERTGLTRDSAVAAKGSVTVAGTGIINIGDLFETSSGIRFKATETKAITTSGNVAIEAVVGGSSGVVAGGTITLFPITLTGFTAVTNPNATTDGFNAESDSDLIKRYYEFLRNPATSANQGAFSNWAKSVSGVGDVKVLPSWNGANTVKLVIINSDKQPASPTVVNNVKTFIDSSTTGIGLGQAPIGTVLTVESAVAKNINIVVDVDLRIGYTLATVTTNIRDTITAYLKEITFIKDSASYAKIGSAILDAEGVDNYNSLTVNGGTSNIVIATNEVPVLGTVTVT